jgi:hypothetical protein
VASVARRLVLRPLAAPLTTVTLAGATLAATPTALAAQRVATPVPPPAPPIQRVRPFITDDARVVGAGLGQVESWLRVDKESNQLWLLGAYGPTRWLEVTVGGVVGEERGSVAATEPTPGRLTYALPLLQGKALLRPYAAGSGPGFALVGGTFLPEGRGFLQLPGYGTFGYLSVSQAVVRRWTPTPKAPDPPLVHVNLGVNRLWIGAGPDETVVTWGLGTQLPVRAGAHIVAEVFSGDPYVPGSGTAWQAGTRVFASERLQVDATVGKGIAGDVILPLWWSAGVRIVVGGAH